MNPLLTHSKTVEIFLNGIKEQEQEKTPMKPTYRDDFGHQLICVGDFQHIEKYCIEKQIRYRKNKNALTFRSFNEIIEYFTRTLYIVYLSHGRLYTRVTKMRTSHAHLWKYRTRNGF